MRLIELHEQAGMNLSPEDLEIAFAAIEPEERTVSELKGDLAKEIIEHGYSRNKGSAYFSLARMHILIHGIAPHDMTERSAEGMFLPSQRMEDFVEQKGIDVDRNIDNARAEIRRRPVKIKRDKAMKLMSAYAKGNPKTGMSARSDHYKREQLIKMIMDGMPVEDAFAQF